METLKNILREIDDSVDYEKETGLITDRILDSFGVISLVSELEAAFDIRIIFFCFSYLFRNFRSGNPKALSPAANPVSNAIFVIKLSFLFHTV